MKKKSSQKKGLKEYQRGFVQHWSPYQQKKQYNALQDPHANYYFYNKSVNKHLKQLRKAVNLQRNAKQKSKLKQLITSKLTQIKLPNIKPAVQKTSIYADQINKNLNSVPSQYRKHSDQTILLSINRQNQNKSSFQAVQSRLRKSDKQIKDINNSYRENKTESMKSSSHINIMKSQDLKKAQEIQKNNQESHAKFLKFLVERKKILTTNTLTNFSIKTELNQINKTQTQTQ